MKVLSKLTIKNLYLNKKRTIATIIGIMLSTALICGVAGLVSSFQKTLINAAIDLEGNYHTTFHDVPKDKIKYITNNEKVEKYFFTGQVGWANLEGSANDYKPYMQILEYDKTALENYGVNLIEGRLPENSNELLISEHIRTNARVDLKVGDTITIDVGKRISLVDGIELSEHNSYQVFEDDLEQTPENNESNIESSITPLEEIVDTHPKTYTIVGIIERLNREEYSSPGYTVITYMEEVGDTVNVSALYKNPKDSEEINKNICKSIGIDEMTSNGDLLRFQGVLSDSTMQVLISIAGIIIFIIVISSVFVIRNSFSISVAEKNRQYGMLSSVGATSKQIKKNVLFEGFIIGMIAVPLGILLGIVAIMILLQVVNYLLNDMLDGIDFVYSINAIPILISVAISFITIYLSCVMPARRAAKISPIESIRGNNDIKLKAKKVRTSKITKKLFGIGGVIASKNLKRSKKKYRTTVISIVVSISIFISLSSFITLGTKMTSLYYVNYSYNLFVANGDKETYEKIGKLDNVKNYAYYVQKYVEIDTNKYGNEYLENFYRGENAVITICIYNNEYFKQYIKELGLEDYKTSAILIDDTIIHNEEDGSKRIKMYNVKSGDKITVNNGDEEKTFVISKNTDKRPMGLDGDYYTMQGRIIISDDYAKELFGDNLDYTYDNGFLHVEYDSSMGALYIESDNPDELENTIRDLIKENIDYIDIDVYNVATQVKQQKRLVLVVAIFLYGFITVISLIGVTNIFNTITTNMILRSKEFAMLKSIGMTKKEFNRMIRLESILYGLKALIIGIPIGILGSYLIYKSFGLNVDFGYELPISAIIISIIFVFIIIWMTMKYSLSKINKQNIIETIRKDNV